MVLLNKLDVDPELAPGVVAERLDEETAFVSVDLGLDQHEPVDLRLQARGHVSRVRPYWRS